MTEPGTGQQERQQGARHAGAPADPVGMLVEQADLLADTRRYDEALRRLDRAAATDPQDPRVPRHRAEILVRAGRPGEALDAADVAIRLDPENWGGWFFRAYALLGMGRKREALDAIHEAHRLGPDSHHVLGVLTTIELVNGNREQAQVAALRCLEVAPESTIAHDAVGEVALATRKWERAEEAYRTLLSLEPTSAMGLNNLGLVCAARGDEVGAMDIYVRALTADPSYAAAHENLLSTADRYLWGSWWRMPRDRRTLIWFAFMAALVQPLAVFFAIYILWFPTRLLRARRRWRRIPPLARPVVAEHQRRFAVDAAATWGLVGGLYLLVLAVTALGAGEPFGMAVAFLAGGIALAAVSLSRVIPRVFRLDWPTRRRPHRTQGSPWDRNIRL